MERHHLRHNEVSAAGITYLRVTCDGCDVYIECGVSSEELAISYLDVRAEAKERLLRKLLEERACPGAAVELGRTAASTARDLAERAKVELLADPWEAFKLLAWASFRDPVYAKPRDQIVVLPPVQEQLHVRLRVLGTQGPTDIMVCACPDTGLLYPMTKERFGWGFMGAVDLGTPAR